MNRIVLEDEGIQQLLKSDEIISYMDEIADQTIEKCKGTYEKETFIGKKRANVQIQTKDEKTFYRNLKNNELLKALNL